jgi:uncharacterized protein YutE (UPF0331/DUF86 family)
MTGDPAELVRTKLRNMLSYLDELEGDLPASLSDYLSAGRVLHRFVERLSQIIVECSTDANGFLLDLLGQPPPSSARGSFDGVHKHNAVSDATHRRYWGTFVGFRNRLVHDYEALDDRIVYHTPCLLLGHGRQYVGR